MNKLVILELENWADEFDYPIFSVAEPETFKSLIEYFEKNPVRDTREFCFGTNEYFEFSNDEILSLLNSAKPIADEELKVLEKFVPLSLGLDIVSHLIDITKGY